MTTTQILTDKAIISHSSKFINMSYRDKMQYVLNMTSRPLNQKEIVIEISRFDSIAKTKLRESSNRLFSKGISPFGSKQGN